MNSIAPISQTGFVIETGVPLPKPKCGMFGTKASPATATLRDLQVGQSIFLPNTTVKKANGFANGARGKARRHMKFAIRSMEGGCRIWRTA